MLGTVRMVLPRVSRDLLNQQNYNFNSISGKITRWFQKALLVIEEEKEHGRIQNKF